MDSKHEFNEFFFFLDIYIILWWGHLLVCQVILKGNIKQQNFKKCYAINCTVELQDIVV